MEKEIIQKRDHILLVMAQLKREFIGIDNVVNEIQELITPWLLFPDAQLRPTVVNLWGLTGSGKTALVNRLVELLNKQDYFAKFDMGEYESSGASWIKATFTDDLEYAHEKEVIICLDEFQFARTLDNNNNELGKDKLRVVWELLDSGKINYIAGNNSYYVKRAELCIAQLLRCAERGVVITNGVVTEEAEVFKSIFLDFYFEDKGRYGADLSDQYFLSRDFIEGVEYLYNDDNITNETIKRQVSVADLLKLIEILQKGLRARFATRTLDLSKALIFVLGNLDEAFKMSHSMNPDISADELYEATRKITVTDVKEALKKRFRNEQIARLGNNHIIYTAFRNKDYQDFIAAQLHRIKEYAFQRFGFTISFDKSIHQTVYSEGVFPAQGTRPVLSTIKNLVESKLAKLVIVRMDYAGKATLVCLSYEENNFVAQFQDSDKQVLYTFKEKAVLKLNDLRKPGNPNLQSHTAVHEAGHAILAALTLRILPSVVVSKTASASADGFCLVNFPEGLRTREILKKDIMISLGGYIAEKMIFGEEHTSTGVYGDIEYASTLANNAIREYAMGSDPIKLVMQSITDNDAFAVQQKYHEEALQLIHSCETKAEELLERNKKLLIEMSKYLTVHSRMEEKEIGEMVIQYSAEEWVVKEGFLKKDNYFEYSNLLHRMQGLN